MIPSRLTRCGSDFSLFLCVQADLMEVDVDTGATQPIVQKKDNKLIHSRAERPTGSVHYGDTDFDAEVVMVSFLDDDLLFIIFLDDDLLFIFG